MLVPPELVGQFSNIKIYALHIQCWEAFWIWFKVSKLHTLIFMAGAGVLLPDEAHHHPPSGSSLFLQSLPSARTPACLPPRWWWSAWGHKSRRKWDYNTGCNSGGFNNVDVWTYRFKHLYAEREAPYSCTPIKNNYCDTICTYRRTWPFFSHPNSL